MANSIDNQKYLDTYIGFEEASGNVLAQGKVGTLSGAPTRVTGWDGKGKAMQFNGTSQWVLFNDLILKPGNKTIRFKIKTTSTSNMNVIYVGRAGIPNLQFINGFGISVYQGRASINAYNNLNSPTHSVIGSILINDNKWHHIDIIIENQVGKIYVDGVFDKSGTFVEPAAYDSSNAISNLCIGKINVQGFETFFNGALDDIEIYHRVLSLTPDKYLIKHDSKFKYHDGSSWKETTNTAENFIQYGHEDLSAITESQWGELSGDISIVMWSDFEDKSFGNVTLNIEEETQSSIIGDDYEMKIHTDLSNENIEVGFTTDEYSSYSLIGEFPTVKLINESEESATLTIETEPFTIYDEFEDEIEVLYYTDDESVTSPQLEIEKNWSPLDDLEGQKELLIWTDEENSSKTANVSGLLKEEFVHLNYWINIKDLISVNVSETGVPARFVIQRKDDMKYYSFYQGHFFEIPLNERMVQNYGLLPVTVNAITTEQWESFLGDVEEIRFCYLFSNQTIATKSVSTLLDSVHTVGTIRILRQIRSTTPSVSKIEARVEKFSLEGRLKDIERITVNNMLALQMQTAAAFNATKLNMHEMIVETFEDAANETNIHVTALTSPTNGVMTVTESSFWSNMAEFKGYKSFDGNPNDIYCWCSQSTFNTSTGLGNEWIQIDYGSPKKVDFVKLTSRATSDSNASIQDFKVLASNDGVNFEEIYSATGLTAWGTKEEREFLLKSTTKRYYRIVITKNHKGSYACIGEVQFGALGFPAESKFNDESKRYEGTFDVLIRAEIPVYASSLYLHLDHQGTTVEVSDGIRKVNVADVKKDTIDISAFNKENIKIKINGLNEDSFLSAIAYAWL